MQLDRSVHLHPAIESIQRTLWKIDGLRLPPSSRWDVESILVRQACRELDRALPGYAGHGRRAAWIALALGTAKGLDADALHDLKLAAWLHDIGLLMVSAGLTKPRSPIDPDDYLTIQHHSRMGAMLLEPFRFLRNAAAIVAHHHERWDGAGYPYGIRGPFIPLGARILAIADAYDAIWVPDGSSLATRNRIALRIIQVSAGTQFDPGLVSVLRGILEKDAGQAEGLNRRSPIAEEPAGALHAPAAEWEP